MQKAYTIDRTYLPQETQYRWVLRIQKWVNAAYLFVALVWQYTTIFQIVTVAVILCHIMVLLFTDRKQLAYAQLVWIFFFVCYFSLHYLAGIPLYPSYASHRILIVSLYYLVINAFICQVSDDESLNSFTTQLTVVMIMLSIFLLTQQAGTLGIGGLGREIRLGSIKIYYPIPLVGRVGYNGNWIGQPSAMAILLQFYMFNKDKNFKRLPIIVLLLVFVFLSGSRKALVLAIGSPMIFLFLKEKDIDKKIKMAFLALIFGFTAVYAMLNIPFIYTIIGARMESYIISLFTQTELVEGSAIYRERMISVAEQYIAQRPWTGYGMDSYQFLEGSLGSYSHNNFTELLVSGGIPAFIAYYWLYAYIIIKTFFLRVDRKKRALSLSIIVLLIFAEYGWVIYLDRILCIPMAIAFFAISSDNREKIEQKKLGPV